MIYTILIALLGFGLFGLIGGYTFALLVHTLLVMGVILILADIFLGRNESLL